MTSRKPPLATEDDQTRRFAADEVERYERDLSAMHSAFALLRHFVRHRFPAADAAALMRRIDALERAIAGI